MCGIAGYSGSKKISKDVIIKTLNLMKKRGPDSQNFFLKQNKNNFT
jgi:asparagine synthetase B (glutamine-hydrolysing)